MREALTPDTALISVGAASGEIGTLQPLREIGHIARSAGVPFHVDAVGALGRIPIAADSMGIDLLSLSGNDLYGPPGTGALWVRPGVKLHPSGARGRPGGRHRSGTENVPGVVGLGVAAELMRAESPHGEGDRLAGAPRSPARPRARGGAGLPADRVAPARACLTT